jgi:transcriptional regulator with PAS, ATPase and Fis domain
MNPHSNEAFGLADNSLATWRAAYTPELLGEDPKIIDLLSMIRRIARTDCDVLITGASGTGKELIARCIHRASRRHKGPFVALNCAAIPKDLMESEIFGHTRGAFTGATERRSGKFEVAAGGTLFLDETGEMDLSMQSKFLRVLQEREVTPVGDSRTFKVDVRIVSATNQDLDDLRRDKLFREDLYYRLNVVPVHLPTLFERPQDILCLAEAFIERAAKRHGRKIRGIDSSAERILQNYRWPGNVREMQHLMERVVILKEQEGQITADDLPSHLRDQPLSSPFGELRLPEAGLDINQTLAVVETRLTLDALQRAGGNKAKAAELLGLKRTTLVERLKKLQLDEIPA